MKKFYKFSDFLKNRKDRFKPNEAKKLGLKRIDKIDFSGNIYVSDKDTNTDMIMVKSGDLVISGINVEKGAISVYLGKEDVLATIHYSSYEYNPKIIDIDYLKLFIKSSLFKKLINSATIGGIKTEIKPKHILPLEIQLPEVVEQKSTVFKTNEIINNNNKLSEHQNELLEQTKKLKQLILQNAIQGKLIPQDPNDEPAEKLLEKIKVEKEKLVREEKLKKEKKLPQISSDKIPFKIPGGWTWSRLNEVGLLERGKSKHRPRNDDCLFLNGKYPLVQTGDVSQSKGGTIFRFSRSYNEFGLKQSRLWKRGTLCITIAANIAETGFLGIEACFPDSVVGFTPVIGDYLSKYVNYFINISKNDLVRFAPSTAQKNINLGILNSLLFPLPPLNEQKRIVEKVESLMKICDEQEKNIIEAKESINKLNQAILSEAFGEELA